MALPALSESTLDRLGGEMYDLLYSLFPICRSITGNGVRETLKMAQSCLPMEILEIPSGAEVFDWSVPDEWNIFDAYILDPEGKKIVDFKANNLHVLGYSDPVDAKLGLPELKEHLYTLPELPDAIPYLTSYYKRRWGFCMRHNDFLQLKDGTYTVKIDSTLKPGSLTIGECVLPGEQEDEVLLSCYTCHPSMANDSISGVVLATFLGKLLSQVKRRYTYRIIFIPETIGAITYLSLNKDRVISKTRAGLIVSFVGDSGPFCYKKSRQGNAEIDRVAEHVLSHQKGNYEVRDFYPDSGADERQYCSPGFDLPMGLLTRTYYLRYPEYHTSLDNLSFVSGENLSESLGLYYEILAAFEMNKTYVNQVMFCEPYLSKRNLDSTLGSQKTLDGETRKIKWLLNYCDGKRDLLEIANKISIPIQDLEWAVQELIRTKLIKPEITN